MFSVIMMVALVEKLCDKKICYAPKLTKHLQFQYYADGEDAYAMKKDLSNLLEQVEKTREQLRCLGKRSHKNALEQRTSIKENGRLHKDSNEEEEFEKKIGELNLSNVDPNICDNLCPGK